MTAVLLKDNDDILLLIQEEDGEIIRLLRLNHCQRLIPTFSVSNHLKTLDALIL
jgi:hypothetical protein